MLTLVNGHWRTEREAHEDIADYDALIADLSEKERKCVEVALREMRGKTGKSVVLERAVSELWETVPVPMAEWLDDPALSGETPKALRKRWRADLIELFREPFFTRRYSEIIITGALGVGKTFVASLAVMRICYELLCLRCPQTAFGLAASDPLYIMPISRTQDLARRVAFGQIAGKLNLAEFFRTRMRETKEEIWFPEKRLFIFGGASNASHALGMNIICALIDESNFLGDSKGPSLAVRRTDTEESYDKAQVIYEALARRISSRFEHAHVSGMVFLISSKRGMHDFTERRLRACAQNERDGKIIGVFVRDYATWDVVPEAYVNSVWYTLAFDQKTGRSRYLADGEEPYPEELKVEFPEEYKPFFDRDPMGAAQDYAGISLEAASSFFGTRTVVERAMKKERVHPFTGFTWRTDQKLPIKWDQLVLEDARGELGPICCRHAPRHVHIDLSKNHCATGFCMAHIAGQTEVFRIDPITGDHKTEDALVYHVDFVLKIDAPPNGEVDHQMVRSLVYVCMEQGVPVLSVSLDRFCSVPNLQQLRKAGLTAEEVSTVRTLDPYLYLRSVYREGRILSPVYEHLQKELMGLVLSNDGKKVEAGPGTTKDLADAQAGCVSYLSENGRSGVFLSPMKGEHTTDSLAMPYTVRDGEVLWMDEIEERMARKERDKKGEDDDLPCYIVS